MSLHEDIKASLKDAMKSRDQVRLRTIRSVITALSNEAVAKGGTPQTVLSDDDAHAVIKRLAKQRRESIEQFEAANRPELAEPEKEELVVLESYLPTMMSQEEIEPIAKAKLEELGITDKSRMGQAIGAVMSELGGKADGGDVKEVVERLLN